MLIVEVSGGGDVKMLIVEVSGRECANVDC